jgi:hypothetical protein
VKAFGTLTTDPHRQRSHDSCRIATLVTYFDAPVIDWWWHTTTWKGLSMHYRLILRVAMTAMVSLIATAAPAQIIVPTLVSSQNDNTDVGGEFPIVPHEQPNEVASRSIGPASNSS